MRRPAPDTHSQARSLLALSRPALQAPLRAELFDAARFALHGQGLGQAQGVRIRPWRRAAFFPRLQDNIAALREADHYLDALVRSDQAVGPAAEWLLDNFHLVAEQARAVHEGLPRRYFRNLPVVAEAPLAGLPRVYGLAWAFVAHTDSQFDDNLLRAFLQGLQHASDLTLGELWALPTTLRVVLVENLRRLCETLAVTEAAREWANAWCDRLDEPHGTGAALDHAGTFERMARRGVGRAFALQVMQRLHADSGAPSAGREALRAVLAQALPDPQAAQAAQTAQEAADSLSVSQAITSLRRIGHADWRGLIAGVSGLLHRLQAMPGFVLEHEATQDVHLHAIERLALRSGRSEITVADTLLRLARRAWQAHPAEPGQLMPQHMPGYWLGGPGSADLAGQLGLRPASVAAHSTRWRRGALLAYLGLVGLGTWALLGAWLPSGLSWTGWALAWLAMWPASEAVMAVVNRLVGETVAPQGLPRLALSQGLAPAQRVLVVVPTMLVSERGIADLVAHLARHHLANVEPCTQFALLADFADADTAQHDSDAALLACALQAIEQLEHDSRAASAPDGCVPARRFLLLVRARRWSDSEQAWIGWERKRGKLAQLVAWLATGHDAGDFIDLGAASRPAPGTPHVITLDSDTVLPPGALRALVGVAAHPLNLPVCVGHHVVSGYGILQPRLSVPLATPGQGTPYHWLFAGQGGLDPYSAASSEVYQDLFGMGTFTGKGLLQVAAVHAALADRLPEAQVLSHDLIEGALARCGGVSDISLIEEAPHHADVAAARLHRWTRGDWQLLPLLWRARTLGISGVDRWKMLDNLRRSLVAPFSVLWLLVCLAAGLSPWSALGLVALALGGGSLMGAVAGLVPHRPHLAWRHFYGLALTDLLRAVGGTLWRLALLLENACSMVDALARALWRQAVSHRGLLQWTAAATVQASIGHGLAAVWRRHAPISLLALLALGALLALHTPTPWLATVLCGLWAATPLWVGWASRPRPPAAPVRLAAPDQAWLLTLAQDTWSLFEQHVGPASHHLPPDNVQTVPTLMVAPRTSPTNIGLYLLSMACARRFGWISLDTWLARAHATLDTLDTLPRHRGHFHNWIDTRTLATLAPAYVSTVDSGNLCGHLIAVAGACDEALADDPRPLHSQGHDDGGLGPSQRQGLQRLAQRCRQMALAPEFGFLLDARRRLFHIGFRVLEETLDDGFYDLLASESRLASLWAIAKGDVPVSHWAALGRPFFAVGALAGLRSWSGSMFEYLMPALVLDEPPGSVLHSAARSAVREQIAYGRRRGVPWGISECAHAAVDHTLAYQYAPQGVPRLAMRRTPPDDLVVAPYASALAVMVDLPAALLNLQALQALHLRGHWGLAEAIDYTPDRQSGHSTATVVHTFMAHHQGMTLVALAQVLLRGAPRRWAMADARLAAMAPLLQEPVPRAVSRLSDPPAPSSRLGHLKRVPDLQTGMHPATQGLQPTQLLSNGRYSVALRPNGAGWSRLGGVDVSRWRDDAPVDGHGSFVYLRRNGHAPLASITQHPAPDPLAHYEASFSPERACLQARWPDLRSRCTVWVHPHDDVECRRIELWNTSSQPLALTVMSMFEVSLAAARADETHPAFSKLFVQAHWQADEQALYLSRQPRLHSEAALHVVHFVAQGLAADSPVQVQASRQAWLGRHRDAGDPAGQMLPLGTPTGALDTGLDPVAALACSVLLPPHGRAELIVATAAAADRSVLQALVRRLRQPDAPALGERQAIGYTAMVLHELRLAPDTLQALRLLTTPLALLGARPPPDAAWARAAQPEAPVADGGPGPPQRGDRRLLWRFGLSGERPFILVSLSAAHGLPLVRALARGLQWWAWGGMAVDLVVLNGEPRAYLTPLQSALRLLSERLMSGNPPPAGSQAAGHLVLLHAEELSAAEAATLALHARVRLVADGRPLPQPVDDLARWHQDRMDHRRAHVGQAMLRPPPAGTAREGEAGPGGFTGDAGAYRFTVSPAWRPLRPWSQVLANASLGCLVTEAGSSFTWAGNSRQNQLTGWSNDPVQDPSAEVLAVQDQISGQVWCLSAGPGCAPVAYEITQEPGLSTHTHRHGPLRVQVSWCVDEQWPLKQVRIVLHNLSSSALRLRVLGLLAWQMGAQHSDRASVRTALARLHTPEQAGVSSRRVDALLATQLDGQGGTGGSTAFVTLHRSGAVDASLSDWTCDRATLHGPDGRLQWPARLSQQAGLGLDPCAALSTELQLAPGHHSQCVFTIGHAASPEQAQVLAAHSVWGGGTAREATARRSWQDLLGAITVRTPDALFDQLVNHWLLYQTVACRLWARAGFYQAGGAYGFRDQLQDAMALAAVAPQLLREQVLRAAARQFVAGDVQHWWHPPLGAGVRTRMSDDLLWLPLATLRHVQVTGDDSLLDEIVAFLDGPPVPVDAEDAYYVPQTSTEQATVYEHGARAIDHSLAVGSHGLPLMGTGDWNDGMNRVGHLGRGESVWLGFFLVHLVQGYAPLARARGEPDRAQRWEQAALGWRQALQGAAWDGHWFVRAFFDDGTPLGSQRNSECRIDLIAQAWSVLSGAGTPSQQAQAMASARQWLQDAPAGLLRLLTPPLAHAQPEAGYIQAYPPGVRENGGQYNHAAIWALMAQAQLGDGAGAYQTFKQVSPAHRSADAQQGAVYGLEPYAVAADIYTAEPWVGRGGWSWYTGSAAWLYRAAIESICGLQLRGAQLRFRPCLPPQWPQLSLVLRRQQRVHRFTVCADHAAAAIADAQAQGAVQLAVGDWLPLDDCGADSHHLVICSAARFVASMAN